MGKARDGEVQIVCMFAEQEVKDAALVLVIHWQWFQQLEEREEVAMGRGGSKKAIFDVLNNADGLTASAEAATERSWAMGLSRGKQSRIGAMDWALRELKPGEQKQMIWKL